LQLRATVDDLIHQRRLLDALGDGGQLFGVAHAHGELVGQRVRDVREVHICRELLLLLFPCDLARGQHDALDRLPRLQLGLQLQRLLARRAHFEEHLRLELAGQGTGGGVQFIERHARPAQQNERDTRGANRRRLHRRVAQQALPSLVQHEADAVYHSSTVAYRRSSSTG
jgi:hypothetical protein